MITLSKPDLEYLKTLVHPEVQHAVTQCSLHQKPSDYEHLLFVRGLFRRLDAAIEDGEEPKRFDDLNQKLSPQTPTPANSFEAPAGHGCSAEAGTSLSTDWRGPVMIDGRKTIFPDTQ